MEVIKVTIILLLIALLLQDLKGHRILLIPFPYDSHVTEQGTLGQALQNSGHEVHMLLPETYKSEKDIRRYPINVIIHKSPGEDLNTPTEGKSSQDQFLFYSKLSIIDAYHEDLDLRRSQCTNALGDETTIKKLKQLNFDIALVDAFPFYRCMLILPYRLNIPFIAITTVFEPWLSRTPALPSFVPFNIGNNAYSDNMTFWERLDNAWILLKWTAWNHVKALEDNLVTIYAKDMPVLTLSEIAHKASIWFIMTDFSLDYARPMMPNEVMIGGTTTRPATRITDKKLKTIISEASEGIVVISFGSLDLNMPEDIINKMQDAFSKMPQHFIWRRRTRRNQPRNVNNKNLPKNIHTMPWIPQNNLLGHAKTKLFISHAGTNGQFEALSHSIPMISFPVYGDHYYNAKRVEVKGFGITMNLHNFTSDELLNNMHEVIYNTKYKMAISKAAVFFKSSTMHPVQRAVYWVEQILENGGEHLRTHGLELKWYEYWMLDLLGFTICIISVSILFMLIVFGTMLSFIKNIYSKVMKMKHD